MPTVEWTNERLNDAFEALRRENALLSEEMRAELRELRAELRAELGEFRIEMRSDMNALADRVHAELRMMWLAMIVSYVTVMSTLVATQL